MLQLSDTAVQDYYMRPWCGWCTMKILVFSDSHSSLRFMRMCIAKFHPDGVIHLGDHYDDGETLALENPHIPFWQVPGNCDLYGGFNIKSDAVRLCNIDGTSLLLTHGHRHGVKNGLERLLRDARASGVDGVFFGHTHCALCRREADGLWVLNPGAAGLSGAVVEIMCGKISACRLIGQADLEL